MLMLIPGMFHHYGIRFRAKLYSHGRGREAPDPSMFRLSDSDLGTHLRHLLSQPDLLDGSMCLRVAFHSAQAREFESL